MSITRKTSGTPAASLQGRQAVVIGGSMAGLLAARVLADHFDRVTIIERDQLVDSPETRKGVPQGRHAHGLLGQGSNIIEGLFPGIFAEVQAAGGKAVDVAEQARWFQFGVWKKRTQSGIIGHVQSRPLLEWRVRRRVAALANVQILDRTDVLHLTSTADRSRITGVRIDHRAAGGGEETLAADLVVDASGRGSRTPAWLEALGYGKVEETLVKVDVGYATRIYRRTKPAPGNVEGMIILPHPPAETRCGILLGVEGDRWIVTLGGWLRDYPPTDEEGFLGYARYLPTPELYETIKDAEPLTPIVSHRLPASQRRHYERLARFPEGLVVLGDALCSFNPIYGQGMTIAAMDAAELGTCLQDLARRTPGNITGLADLFRKRVTKIVDVPWLMVVSEDARYPQVDAPRPPMTQFMHWYLARLHVLAATDQATMVLFMYVMNMLKPATALFTPRLLWKALTLRQPAPAAAPARIDTLPTPAEVKRAA